MDATTEKLIDAAEAVLDSECGVMSLHELAEALFEIDPSRDYRAPATEPNDPAHAVLEYDESTRWVIATARLGPNEYGASIVVARDVLPDFGQRLARALAPSEPVS